MLSYRAESFQEVSSSLGRDQTFFVGGGGRLASFNKNELTVSIIFRQFSLVLRMNYIALNCSAEPTKKSFKPTEFSTRNREIPWQDGPLGYFLRVALGFLVHVVDGSLDGFQHRLVLAIHHVGHNSGVAAQGFAPLECGAGEELRRLGRVWVNFSLEAQQASVFLFSLRKHSIWVCIYSHLLMLTKTISYLESDQHRQEFLLVANQHAVTDHGQLFLHQIFYWNGCHILSSCCDDQF